LTRVRLRSDLWVAAYLRRCGVEGQVAVLRRRGAAEAGAIFVKVDRLDGRSTLYAPAPQSLAAETAPGVERLFARAHDSEWIESVEADRRLTREVAFDPDVWIIEVEDRDGRTWLDLAG
jgi:hypothetical protein